MAEMGDYNQGFSQFDQPNLFGKWCPRKNVCFEMAFFSATAGLNWSTKA